MHEKSIDEKQLKQNFCSNQILHFFHVNYLNSQATYAAFHILLFGKRALD